MRDPIFDGLSEWDAARLRAALEQATPTVHLPLRSSDVLPGKPVAQPVKPRRKGQRA